MKYSIVLAAVATAVSAQVTFNDNGTFTCAIQNGAYCAGDSLTSNIIIRCSDYVGQPGNCNDNLAGYPPVGVNYSPCYQTSNTAGDAACSKNGIVYPDGNSTAPFPVPGGNSTISASAQTSTSYAQTVSVMQGTTQTQLVLTNCGNGTIVYGSKTVSQSHMSVTPVPTGGYVSSASGSSYTVPSASKTSSVPVATYTGAANAIDVAANFGFAIAAGAVAFVV